MLGLPELRRILKGMNILYAVRMGSWVYGVAREDSDTDFVAVVEGPLRDKLLFGHDYNVTLYTPAEFQGALDEHSLYALEALMAPPEHRLIDARWVWVRDSHRLLERALEKSGDDWAKGVKLLADDPAKAVKKIWHSLRLLLFARQLLERGRIDDFEIGIEVHLDLVTSPEVEVHRWDALRQELRRGLGGSVP